MSTIKLSLPSMGKAQELFKNNISKPVSNAIDSINISDVAVNVRNVAVNVSNNVEEFAISAKDTISSTGAKVSSTFSNVKESVSNSITNDFVPWASNAANKLIERNIKTTATVGTGLTSLVEGIAKFGGSIVDTGAILISGFASIVTGCIDAGQAIHGAITGKEWNSVTKSMWDGTMNFVKTEYVGNAFDSFYENTGVGSWLKENSYGFDTTRGIGNAVGEIAGLIALTFFTAGIGTAATGAGAAASGAGAATSGISTAVSTTAKVANSSSKIMAGINAASGLGRGAEKSWNEGASCLEGLGYGSLLGVWNAIQVGVGMKIQGLKWPFPEGMSGKMITKVLNSATHVILDGIDNGAEAFAQPLLEMTYKDKDYQTLFEEAGGWSNFGTQAVAGSFFSILGEAGSFDEIFTKATTNVVESASINKVKVSDLEMPSLMIREFSENLSYVDYDYVYTNSKNLRGIIEDITQNNIDSKNLIVIDSTKDLDFDIIQMLPENTKIRIKGGYTNEYMNGMKAPNGGTLEHVTFDKDELTSIMKEIELFESKINPEWNSYQKAYYAYEYLQKNLEYNPNPGGTSVRAKEYDGLLGLVKRTSTCQGYSHIYKELLERMNIKCTEIAGKYNGVGQHAYNIVEIVDDVFIVDTVSESFANPKNGFGANEIEKYFAKNNSQLLSKVNTNLDNISNKFELNNPATNSNLDDELELAFFSGNKNKKEFINKIKESSNYIQNNNMSSAQKSYVNQINELLQKDLNGFVNIKLNNTNQITPAMLNSIDDLSRVKVSFDNSYRDINGNLKIKYNKAKYIDRITYTGSEALSIVSRLDQLQSKIDMTLPTKERAYQIYKLLASEIPVMRDYNSNVDGHMVAASFRGLTDNNIVGKEGLVCAGYASVYKELCNRCGITCDYIRGIAILDPLTGKKNVHAWNIVLDANGEVIPVDVTWKVSEGHEWFGKSEAFANSHITDLDEYFNDYSPKINMPSSNSNSVIDNIVNIINQKYGPGTGITALENYLNTGNKNSITRANNARAMLDQINMNDINNYLLKNSPNFRNNQLSNIEYIMDQKFGYEQGKIRLVKYINTGDASVITRTNNARQIVQSISIDDIVNYLNGGLK